MKHTAALNSTGLTHQASHNIQQPQVAQASHNQPSSRSLLYTRKKCNPPASYTHATHFAHTREKCNHPAGASDAEPPRCLICLGELGMGNTTAAAALLAALTGALPTDVCGRGTGAIEKSEKVILDYAGHKEVMFKKENLRGFLARSPYRGPSH